MSNPENTMPPYPNAERGTQASPIQSEKYPTGVFSPFVEKPIVDVRKEREQAHESMMRSQRDVDVAREEVKFFANNANYYRSLVVKIGEMFGEAAKTSDDGSVQQDVLCAKVPELVAKLFEKWETLNILEEQSKPTLAGYPVVHLKESESLSKTKFREFL